MSEIGFLLKNKTVLLFNKDASQLAKRTVAVRCTRCGSKRSDEYGQRLLKEKRFLDKRKEKTIKKGAVRRDTIMGTAGRRRKKRVFCGNLRKAEERRRGEEIRPVAITGRNQGPKWGAGRPGKGESQDEEFSKRNPSGSCKKAERRL